jgi:hypothetical protein
VDLCRSGTSSLFRQVRDLVSVVHRTASRVSVSSRHVLTVCGPLLWRAICLLAANALGNNATTASQCDTVVKRHASPPITRSVREHPSCHVTQPFFRSGSKWHFDAFGVFQP